MQNDRRDSTKYKKSYLSLDDRVGTTPGERAKVSLGCFAGPFGILGGGSSLCMRLITGYDELTSVPALVAMFALTGYCGSLTRRSIEARDPDQRVTLLRRLRRILLLSIGASFAGLAISLAVFFFPPRRVPELWAVGAAMSLGFSVIGLLMTPFAFAARRISWLANPR